MTPTDRPIHWITGRPGPLDLDGPAEIPFEPMDWSWCDKPPTARFELMAERYPDRPAIVDDHGARLSYTETRNAVRDLARRIDAAVPRDGVVVAILPVSAIFPVAILAAMAAGRTFVPIDITLPADRKAAILKEAGAGLLVHAGDCELDPDIFSSNTPRLLATLEINSDAAPLDLPPTPAAIVGLGFTSGSTGRPKGVAYTVRAGLMVNAELTNACHINPDDCILGLAPLSMGGAKDAQVALTNGALFRVFDFKTRGMDVLRVIREEGVTILSFIPLIMRTLMQAPDAEQIFRSVRVLDLYGERTSAADIALFRAKAPDCHIRIWFGSTEAGPIFNWFVPRDFDPKGGTVPVGYLSEGKSILLLDEDGAPVAPGEVGELIVRSRDLAPGAWQDGELRPGPFVPDPLDPTQRIYQTGDLMRLGPDGLAEFVARADRGVKILGLRADLGEVEAVLRSVEGVREAVAIVGSQEGQADRLVAFIAPSDPAKPPSAAGLRKAVIAEVGRHASPAQVHFLPAIPRLANHKPDLVRLKAMLEPA